MDQIDRLSERVQAVRDDALGRPFSDTAARDIACELAECMVEVVALIREHRRAAMQAANDASCLANGMRPD